MGKKKAKNKYYFFLEDYPDNSYVLWYSCKGRQYVVKRYSERPDNDSVVETAREYLKVNSESG